MRTPLVLLSLLAVLGGSSVAYGATPDDPYGVTDPLEHSSKKAIGKKEALAHPEKLITLAGGLQARVINSRLPLYVDQGALWPSDDKPEWLISCNEYEPDHPGLLRINLATGKYETILTGTGNCDPIRRTAWGTLIFGEEWGGGKEGGRLYELKDPLHTTGVKLDRDKGTFKGGTGAKNFAIRTDVGRLSYEGIAVLPNGVMYYSDESRPEKGKPGGAIFKFVPDKPYKAGQKGSPLAHGRVYGLRLGKHEGGRDYGQGTQYGQGAWVPIRDRTDPDLTGATAEQHLTGYYRPEDMDLDLKNGKIRICVSETGNEDEAQFWGTVVCVDDGTVAQSAGNGATPMAQPFILGNPEFNMPDNIAFQPRRGNWIVHEDGDTDSDLQGFHGNDLWSCQPDGADADLQSDGCVRVATMNDGSPTGGVFDATGTHFYFVNQWNGTGYGVLYELTGWQ